MHVSFWLASAISLCQGTLLLQLQAVENVCLLSTTPSCDLTVFDSCSGQGVQVARGHTQKVLYLLVCLCQERLFQVRRTLLSLFVS